MKSKNKTKDVSFMGKYSDFQMHVIIFGDIGESTVCLNFSKEWYLCYSNIFSSPLINQSRYLFFARELDPAQKVLNH